jgi:D-glycero-D-manno-heptose 1,7-bisphosphate phosphatase
MSGLPRLVLIGRDGVVNERTDAPLASPDQWMPIPGSLEAIGRLNHSGIRVAVISNQPGLSDGTLDPDQINRVHARLHAALARVGGHLDAILFCPHTAEALCSCRKPAPALLRSVSLRFGIPLQSAQFIGDCAIDVAAARAARATPVLVRTGLGIETLTKYPDLAGIPNYADLADAVDALLESFPE